MKPSQLVIKNATGVIENSKGELITEKISVAVRDGVITDIGSDLKIEADQVINGEHLHLLPGLIDTQVHLRQPGLEHKETIEAGF